MCHQSQKKKKKININLLYGLSGTNHIFDTSI